MSSPEFFRLAQALRPLLGSLQREEEPMDINTRMGELYSPEHTASDRLMSMIDTMPKRKEPGLGRKILAGAAAFGGNPQNVDKALYGSYDRDLADWKEQLNPVVQAANFERYGNANERQIANMIAMQESRDASLARQTRRDQVLERQGDQRLQMTAEQNAARNELAALRAKGGVPQYDEKTGKGKMVFKDGTSVDIDVNKLPFEDRLELQQQFALERIERSGAQARQTKETPSPGSSRVQTDVIVDPDDPTGNKRILVERDPDTGEWVRAKMKGKDTISPTTRTPETEANKATRLNLKARELKDADAINGKYINIDKSGRYTGLTKPGRFFGPTLEVYRQLYQAIHGEPPAEDNKTVVQPNTSTNKGTTRADGKTHVRRKSDGTTGWVTNPNPALYDVIP